MRRGHCFCWFAQASPAVLIALVVAGSARADTIRDFFIGEVRAEAREAGSCFPSGSQQLNSSRLSLTSIGRARFFTVSPCNSALQMLALGPQHHT